MTMTTTLWPCSIAAREWISDFHRTDFDPEEIDDLSDAVVFCGIERHYEGGAEQFVSDCDAHWTP